MKNSIYNEMKSKISDSDGTVFNRLEHQLSIRSEIYNAYSQSLNEKDVENSFMNGEKGGRCNIDSFVGNLKEIESETQERKSSSSIFIRTKKKERDDLLSFSYDISHNIITEEVPAGFEKAIDVVFGEAYDQAHSGGEYEVYCKFNELMDFLIIATKELGLELNKEPDIDF